MPATKRLAILGSTGSIGRQTLEVADLHPERMRVVALATGTTEREETPAMFNWFESNAVRSPTTTNLNWRLRAEGAFARCPGASAWLRAGKVAVAAEASPSVELVTACELRGATSFDTTEDDVREFAAFVRQIVVG